MSMRIANPAAEAQALMTVLLQPNALTRTALYNELRPLHFSDGGGIAAKTIARRIYEHITECYVDAGAGIPYLRSLLVAELPADIKTWLEQCHTQPCLDRASWSATLQALAEANNTRKYQHVHRVISDSLNADDPVDHALIADALAAAVRLDAPALVRTSTSQSSSELVRARGMHYLDPQRRRQRGLMTGWSVFDKVTGGLQPGQVCLLAANSGGCKSMGALQIGVRAYAVDHKVAYVNLEMDEEELWLRRISNVTNTPYRHVNDLTDPRQRETIWADYEAHFHGSSHGVWDDYSRRNGNNAMATIRELDSLITPNYYDLVIIDYISLLDREDKDDKLTEEQWLRRTVDKIKRLAKDKNCVVLLLAQLTKDGELAQAKSMRNGVDYMLKWKYEVVDGVRPERIDVIIDKARSPKSPEVSFVLDARRIDCCRLTDYVDGRDADFLPVPQTQAQEF